MSSNPADDHAQAEHIKHQQQMLVDQIEYLKGGLLVFLQPSIFSPTVVIGALMHIISSAVLHLVKVAPINVAKEHLDYIAGNLLRLQEEVASLEKEGGQQGGNQPEAAAGAR